MGLIFLLSAFASIFQWQARPDTCAGNVARCDGSWAEPIPAGVIVMTLTTCPAGFAEAAALDGRTMIATLAAHGDVGTTGGADTINFGTAVNVSLLGLGTALTGPTPMDNRSAFIRVIPCVKQ